MTDYRTEQADAIVTHVEQPLHAALEIVDLNRESGAIDQTYKNFVLLNVNDHCLRMAVMEGEFRWHRHPRSDECFLVLEGELEIDLASGETFRLKPGQAMTIPAGVVHRSRSRARAVNLCFENRDAYNDVVFEEEATPSTK